MADTEKTIGTAAQYADPILWAAAQGGVNDGNRQVGVMINDISINALFRPNQTFVNGGLLRGNVIVTGEPGIGIVLSNSATSRIILGPTATVDFQDFYLEDGGVTKSYGFQQVKGSTIERVLILGTHSSAAVDIIPDSTGTTLKNVVTKSQINQSASSVAGGYNVEQCLVIDRMICRGNNALVFKNSQSIAANWYLGQPVDAGATSLVNFCYIKENVPANELGVGSSDNTINTDTTLEMVDFAGGDYRIKSTSTLATAGDGGTFVGAFLEVSSGITITPDQLSNLQTLSSATLTQKHIFAVDNLSTLQSLSSPVLTQQNNLSVNDLSSTQVIDNVSLSVSGSISVNNMNSLQTITQPALTQAHILSVDSIETGQTLSNVLLAVSGVLEVQGLTQEQVITNVSLVQKHLLSVDNLSQVQALGNVTLAVEGVLSVDSILSEQTVSNSSLITQVALLVDNITNQQFISVVSFDEGQTIGTITAAFKEDDISVKYGILNITVKFKE